VASIILARSGRMFWIRLFELLMNFTKKHSSLLGRVRPVRPHSVRTLAKSWHNPRGLSFMPYSDGEGDKHICVDLRIFRPIYSKRVDDMNRVCFE